MTATHWNAFAALLGRILMASVFVPSGYGKVVAAQATAQFMASAGLAESAALAVAVGLFEIAAGLMLAVGFKTRWAALSLAAFTFAASLLFHNFWSAPAEQQFVQQLLFAKNIGLVGGLLFLAALGGGPMTAFAEPSAGTATARRYGVE